MKISLTTLNYFHKAHFVGGGRIKPVVEYGCYHCGRIYNLANHPIEEWIDGGQTALCPTCGIDAVIPKLRSLSFTEADMKELEKEMFNYDGD